MRETGIPESGLLFGRAMAFHYVAVALILLVIGIAARDIPAMQAMDPYFLAAIFGIILLITGVALL